MTDRQPLSSTRLEEVCAKYVSLVGDEDVDALMALFADDCTVEDPVGTEPRVGRDAVREFYATLPPMDVTAELAGPVHASADSKTAAFPFEIDTGGSVINVIDVMTFDDDGKISSMTAYWKM